MGFEYTNSRGQKYYLHTRGGKLFFFSKDPTDALDSIPEGMEIMENEKTGLPMVRRKK